ncbi:MAG: deoxyribodipyrimidine photo-lyase [Bacteroidota bacterium]
MHGNRVILWFRQDLRLHDNEALQDAMRHGKEIIPVYVFDERLFLGKTKQFGFPKTGKYRAQFIIESVEDLRQSLRKLGSDLYVRVGKTEDVLFEMAQQYKTSWVFCNRERTRDEEKIQDALEKKLWSIGQEIRYSRGKMLYYTSDLPFPVTHTPDTFASFRKEVERFVQVRQPLARPVEKFPYLTVRIDAGDMPTVQDFGHEDGIQDERAAIQHKGGETIALQRLQTGL